MSDQRTRNTHPWTVSVGIGLAALLAMLPARAQLFTVTDLGTLPGDTFSWGRGISADGQAVGQSGPSFIHGHGFVWQNGEMSDLEPLQYDDHAEANAINDSGVIVGSSYYFVSGYPYSHAVRWVDGVPEALPPINGSLCNALSINASGYVVGWSHVIPGPPWNDSHACLWDPHGTPTDLGTLGGSFSTAQDINTAGQVVGGAYINAGVQHAFFWQSGMSMSDLGTLGGDNSFAMAINDAGLIVGYSEITPGSDQRHAFLYRPDSGMTDLDTLGGERSEAYDINAAGWIVGKATDIEGNMQGCLWVEGKPRNLNNLTANAGNLRIVEARAINDRYEIVATAAVDDTYHAVLLVPVAVAGDVDHDGDVDLQDLAALLAAYGICAGDPGFNPDADFNHDRCVDLSDLAILLANYGYPNS